MKTIELNLYQFQELSKEAQQKAINNNREINTDYEWFSSCYDDIENIGATIESFDLYRKDIQIVLNKPINEIINTILTEHGEECETYKLAESFNKAVRERVNEGLKVDFGTESRFKGKLSRLYLNMLQKEYEYLMSDEVIQESLIANEYDFLETGVIY